MERTLLLRIEVEIMLEMRAQIAFHNILVFKLQPCLEFLRDKKRLPQNYYIGQQGHLLKDALDGL